MEPRARQQTVAWLVALAAAWLSLAALGYRARDPDSRLYAEMAARMSEAPAAGWIAPDAPPGSYISGRFREHPAGLFWPAALLARLGYPPEQAAYALNALYQCATLVLIPVLAATLVSGSEARALAWLLQLLPIAFTYRVRANHEAALLLCLVLALAGTEWSRRHARFATLTALGLVGMLLVKGIFAAFGPVACGIWLLASRRDPERAVGKAWAGLALAVAAMAATAVAYEWLYRSATGEPFWSFYVSRQLGVAALGEPVIERQDVVLHGFNQPELLQLVQHVGLFLRQISRLAPILRRVVQLPHVVVERDRLDLSGFPRSPMLGDRRPALVIDAAVAEHLEVLGFMALGRGRIVE